MSVLNEIFVKCAEQGVGLTLVDGNLEVTFDQMPTDDLLVMLKENKSQLVDYLAQSDKQPSNKPNIERLDSEFAPLSYTQKRIWFAQQYDTDSVQYNICHPLELKGQFNFDWFKQSIEQVVARHEILRTTYSKSEPLQAIQTDSSIDIITRDVSDVAESSRQQHVDELINTVGNASFDLTQDKMLRVLLIKHNDAHYTAVFTFHHIACDGWSLGLFVNEFSDNYRRLSRGEQGSGQALPVQYSDYVYWLDKIAESLEQDLDYWMQLLADCPPVHQLPLDRPRPELQQYEGGLHQQHLSADLVTRIDAVCQQYDVTPFMLLYATFALVLKHYSGQSDIVVGTPIAGRTSPQLNDLIGCFANTLALRSDLSQLSDFATLLSDTKQMLLNAYSHQDAPFDVIVERMNPERNLSYSPIVQILFAFHNQQQGKFDLDQLQISSTHGLVTTVKSDLDIAIHQLDSGFAVDWRFARAIFDSSTIERISESYALLLNAVVSAPTLPLKQVDYLPAQDKQLLQPLVERAHQVSQSQTGQLCIHQLFEAQVAARPDAVALAFEDGLTSYCDLNARANQLAHYLRAECGVKPDSLVGIYLDRTDSLILVILAILKAGGAYVPLDPDYPSARIDYILQDSKLKTVVTTASILADKPLSQSDLQIVDISGDCGSGYPQQNLNEPALNASHLAYVIYTSGSTGEPKGVTVSHHNVVRLFQSAEQHFDFGGNDVWALFHSYAFDFSVWEIWGALAYGGRLVVIPYWVSRSNIDFYRLVAKEKVTILNQTPSAFASFMQQDQQQGLSLDLRYVIFGGEALNFASLQPWFDRYGDEQPALVNMYGITETTVHVTYQRVNSEIVAQSKVQGTSVIGQPLADLAVLIVDDNQQLVPVGVSGQMYVAGAGVTRGYLHREQLTQERFVDLDVGLDKSVRCYRTGDLARLLPNGELVYLGREDHQVKIRGFRIELGEIQAALTQLDGVSDAFVHTSLTSTDELQIVAYVVSDNELASDSLREQLSAQLPSHMIPAAFIVLEQLPLTNNGKVNIAQLPAPDMTAAQSHYVAPSNELERQLCQIWQQTLKLEQVGVDDNFFAIGGHSLLAADVVMAIGLQLDIEVSIKDIFQQPTVKGIANFIASDRFNGCVSIARRYPLSAKAVEDQPAPLSYAQQRLWIIDKLNAGGVEYNMFNTIPVKTGIDVDKLELAIKMIIERHEPLRTVFVETDDGPVQVVKHDVDFAMERYDFNHLAANQQQQKIDELIEQQQTKEFDLSSDLMVRVVYVDAMSECQKQQGGLLVTVAHIAFDGVSVDIFLAELDACYQAILAGTQADLPPLTVTYRDYAIWQRELNEQGLIEQQLEYWRKRLVDMPQLHSLPLDGPRPKVQTFDGIVHRHKLTATQIGLLNEMSQQHNTTLFVLLQTLYALWVGRYSNQQDVVISVPVAGREEPQLQPLIGFFVNNHVVRTQLDGKQSFTELLIASTQLIVEDQQQLDVPYDLLVNDINPTRSAAYNPVAQLRFSLDNVLEENSQLALSAKKNLFIQHFVTTSRFDLALHVINRGESIELFWVSNPALFAKDSLTKFAQSFEHLMDGALANPFQIISELEYLPADDKAMIDSVSHAESLDFPDLPIHQLFERQTQATPQAIAVACAADNEYSYQQINQAATTLARQLLSINSPKSLIGLAMGRSSEAMVAILAVLKAGCAYVPIDPDYPKNRISYMIGDANISTLLVHEADSEKYAGMATHVVALDHNGGNDTLDASGELAAVSADDLATVIYTSGSTGQPKGVMLSHAGILAYCYSGISDYANDDLTGSFVMTSLSFGVTVPCLFIPLLTGGRVELFEQQASYDDMWQRIIHCDSPRLLRMTPAHIRTLSALPDVQQPPAASDAQHVFVIGGDQFTGHDLALLRQFFPQSQIFNHYGCTEVIVGCSLFDTVDVDPANTSLLPVGRPLKNVSLYVLDEYQQPVAVGVSGELYVYRHQLAQGYLNQTEETAMKLYPHSLVNPNAAADEQMFATGDRAKFNTDGQLVYLGRGDDQVQLRGFRVELGEIEQQIKRLEQVSQAVVTLVGEGLCAYVVFNAAASDDEDMANAVRQHLKAQLPDYMVPTFIMPLDALPLTPNGKLDRKALPDPSLSAGQNSAYQPPRNDIETTLCQLFEQLLELEQVGINDDFFQLGGHSLLGVNLMTHIRQSFAVDMPVRVLFEASTVADLAIKVEQQQAKGQAPVDEGEMITTRYNPLLQQADSEEIEL